MPRCHDAFFLRTRSPVGEEGEKVGDADVAVVVEVRIGPVVVAEVRQQQEQLNGRYKTVRSVETITDDDNFVVSMYDTTPDGKEFKMMEMSYTRKQ